MNQSKGSKICPTCFSACPASLESKEEELINQHVSVTGNGIFLRKVYDDVEQATDTEIKICDRPLIPAIVWETSLNVFGIGYEVDKAYDEIAIFNDTNSYCIFLLSFIPKKEKFNYNMQTII